MNATTEEQRAWRSLVLKQLRGVAMCQAIGLGYVEGAPALTAEIAWHDGLSTREGTHVHRGALLALADQLLGADIPIARGYHAAQATISLRADWLTHAPAGASVHCTAEETIFTKGAAFARARVSSAASPATVAIITAEFIEGSNPGGSRHSQMFENEPPVEPFVVVSDFDTYLGLEKHRNGGYVVLPRSRLIGHPFVPAFHGGIVAAALDEAAWRTVKPLGATRAVTSTTSYFRPVSGNKPLRVTAEILRKGRSLIVARAVGWQDAPDCSAAICELVVLT
ncbi:MAG: PaaI family thioesterase [Janthinobacterium lividum]